MKPDLCVQLDDFLLGCLTADEAAAFERHLEVCPECRRQQAVQNRIDGLLAETAECLEEPPKGLFERTRRYAETKKSRKTLGWACVSAVAAVLLVAAIFGVVKNRGELQSRDQNVVESPFTLPPNVSSKKIDSLEVSKTVKLADPSSGMVLECKNNPPNVRIVYILPSAKPSAPTSEPNTP